MQVDLLNQFGALPFNLEFFTDLQDVERLLPYLDAPPADPRLTRDDDVATSTPETPGRIAFREKRRRLHAAMCELLDDFSLVSFETLNIQDAESVGRVLALVDKSNGYVFGASESNASANAKYASSLFQAVSTSTAFSAERTLFVQEKYRKDPTPMGDIGRSASQSHPELSSS